ncbi:MAG: hypothetical protein NVS4B3_22410 [Gemmatimonadaceae bacterium]
MSETPRNRLGAPWRFPILKRYMGIDCALLHYYRGSCLRARSSANVEINNTPITVAMTKPGARKIASRVVAPSPARSNGPAQQRTAAKATPTAAMVEPFRI